MARLLQEIQGCLINQQRFAKLNAFIHQFGKNEIEELFNRTIVYRADVNSKPLLGASIGIKDNICVKNLPTTCGSRTLSGYTCPFNATVCERLYNSGAVIVGKTNMDEFGMGSHTLNSAYGPVLYHNDISPGGSSGGSAVAVATHQCKFALGTDTGGSVRLPAAFTGIIGYKPSYGLLSRWGVIAFANSLDTVGIFAHDMSGIVSVYRAINGPDSNDPTCLTSDVRNKINQISSVYMDDDKFIIKCIIKQSSSKIPVTRPLRIGIPVEYNIDDMEPVVQQAWQSSLRLLQRKGCSIHRISLPLTFQALPTYWAIAFAEASSNLARYDGVRYGVSRPFYHSNDKCNDTHNRSEPLDSIFRFRTQNFQPETKFRILLGTHLLGLRKQDDEYFLQAQRVRRLIQDDFNTVFSQQNVLNNTDEQLPTLKSSPNQEEIPNIDVIVTPTSPILPPNRSLLTLEKSHAHRIYNSYLTDIFLVPSSLAGLPAISIPFPLANLTGERANGVRGRGNQAPFSVGIQIIGQYGSDELVLGTAKRLLDAIRETEEQVN